MESIAIALAETFDFFQPFCSVAMRKQSAFESSPLKQPIKAAASSHTMATETDMTDHRQQTTSSFAQVYYLPDRCDTSLTSSLSEDEMFLPYDPSFHSQHYYNQIQRPASVPTDVTFFTPRKRTESLHGLNLQWHVKRSVGGHKGIDEWTGRLLEQADARQDVDGLLGQVTCFRISPTFQLPTDLTQRCQLEAVHPHLAALSEYMSQNTASTTTTLGAVPPSLASPEEASLFGLPLVLITNVQVSEEYRGMGLGLLLVDETCRCLANPAQWVLLATQEQSLRDYFGLLGFTESGMLEGKVIIRWNDPFCMATHRYEDLCPHLPRVAIQ